MEPMNSIFLTGFMGSGKTTVGQLLAERIGSTFVDLDQKIVDERGCSISSIFDTEGETFFRDLESSALSSLACSNALIVSTGGGIVGRSENRDFMKKNGHVVYLHASWSSLQERLADSTGRPLAQNGADRKLYELWQGRLPLYQTADVVIDTDGLLPEQVVDKIIAALSLDEAEELMETLTVGLAERSYDIHIGYDIIDLLGSHLVKINFPRRVVVVTNETVAPLYLDEVTRSLESEGIEPLRIVLPDGEQYKNYETLNAIYTQLIELGCDRNSGIVALGGGVIGDMAGYAAATFLRGIPFVQVPTTLLSQVDSSVGGKTAINHPLGKNMIGAFYQPRLVLIDCKTLETLSKRDLKAGIAEVIKYGVIYDEAFFSWLESHTTSLLQLDKASLIHTIKTSCDIKAKVVEQDEREGSLRAILNYGHTFGHAVEQLSGYGVVLHGEAVAIGMVVAAQLSEKIELCSGEDIARLQTLLEDFGLSVAVPDFPLDDYLGVMCRDKKVQDGVLRMVFNRGIGGCEIRSLVDPERSFAAILS
jgi:3-dehydroquinate synthase